MAGTDVFHGGAAGSETVGTFRVPMTVGNPFSGASTTIDALVDTGATLTTLPPSVARALQLEREETRRVRLADGSIRTLGMGSARIMVQGRSAMNPILFSEDDAAMPLLGAVTLESMGWAVDPVEPRLVSQELLLV